MRTVTWLRSASILTLVHAIGHTVGGVYGTPAPGPQQTVIDVMKSSIFLVMGYNRSLWHFYHGMGLAVTILLTVEAWVFWLLGNVARDSDADLRDVLVIFVLGYLALAVNSLRYFFVAPVFLELLIAACLVMAILSIKPTGRQAT